MISMSNSLDENKTKVKENKTFFHKIFGIHHNVVEHDDNTQGLRRHIINNIIQPTYINNIQSVLKWGYRWRMISSIIFIMSLIMMSISTIMQFYASYLNFQIISFIAGLMNIVAQIFIHFSSIAKSKSKKIARHEIDILRQLEVEGLPYVKDDKKKELQDIVINKDTPENKSVINSKSPEIKDDLIDDDIEDKVDKVDKVAKVDKVDKNSEIKII